MRRLSSRFLDQGPVGRSGITIGLAAPVAILLALDMAVAQGTVWKECELADRDPDRSIAACSQLLARSSSPVRSGTFHNRGLAFAAKGDLDKAISDISAGIQLDPQAAYRWQERGELYTRQGKYQQGIADITEAIRRDPISRAFRFHNRAEAYRGLGDLTRAIEDFDQAIRLDPVARPFRLHDRGNALRDAGQYDRALADYETALKLAPTDAWLLVDRGRTFTKMGQFEAAKSDLDNALRLDPSNLELQRAVELESAALPAPSPPSIAPPSQERPSQSTAIPTGPTPREGAETTTPTKPTDERPRCETFVISKPYFLAACIAKGMDMSGHSDGLSDARAAVARERDSLDCASDSLLKLRQMAELSAARVINSGSISRLMDFSDAMKLECNKAANLIFNQSASQGK